MRELMCTGIKIDEMITKRSNTSSSARKEKPRRGFGSDLDTALVDWGVMDKKWKQTASGESTAQKAWDMCQNCVSASFLLLIHAAAFLAKFNNERWVNWLEYLVDISPKRRHHNTINFGFQKLSMDWAKYPQSLPTKWQQHAK